MCLGIPMQIAEVSDDGWGRVTLDSTGTRVNLSLINHPQPGDYVIVHAGFAIEKLDAQEADIRLGLFDELARSYADGG
ncbi:MAG: HypC/HybG/HupF family hydrogenase formation chaperone [Spartobacteria bacterium]|nr:HypC/HybG/HupF family hydrogenase formation chaperone [Spartobacteria bacterium]